MTIKYFLLLLTFPFIKADIQNSPTTPNKEFLIRLFIEYTKSNIDDLTNKRNRAWNLYYEKKEKLSNFQKYDKELTQEQNEFCIQTSLSTKDCEAFFIYLKNRDTSFNNTDQAQEKNFNSYLVYANKIKEEMNKYYDEDTLLLNSLAKENTFHTILLEKLATIITEKESNSLLLYPTKPSDQSLSDKLKDNPKLQENSEENNSDTTIIEVAHNEGDFEN